MTGVQRVAYWLAVVLVVALALYNGFWLGLDLGVRLGLIKGVVFGINAREFTLALSPWSVALFTISALASFLAAGLIVRRSQWAVWAFGAMLAAGIADWILLTANAHYDGSGPGLVSTALTIVTMGLLVALRGQRVLR